MDAKPIDFYEALWVDLRGGIEGLVARRRRRRRRVFAAVSVTAAALVVGAAAFGASKLLGWPAPPHVQSDIAGVDQGMPSDLRLNPDAKNARAVAVSTSSTLYAADLADGGHCTEIVTADGRGRGATCTTAAELATQPIELTLPSDDGTSPSAPVTIGGHVNVRAEHLEIAYGDRTREISFGDDRYFVYDVPAEDRPAAHASDIAVTARASDGHTVARSVVPNSWDEPAVPDDRAPLYVSTRSDESDFTKVYGIEGHVSAPGAAKLELRYVDGTTAAIPIEADGSFLYTVPSTRIGDFMRPQLLVALDSRGNVVARASVAAVAYWRAAQRHR